MRGVISSILDVSVRGDAATALFDWFLQKRRRAINTTIYTDPYSNKSIIRTQYYLGVTGANKM